MRNIFQSTSPRRGTTFNRFTDKIRPPHFNPRPPEGGRRYRYYRYRFYQGFQSTSPRRGTTRDFTDKGRFAVISIHVPQKGDDMINDKGEVQDDISIHVPQKGDDGATAALNTWETISIHVPQKGDDKWGTDDDDATPYISIHVPQKGDDYQLHVFNKLNLQFQSTSPRRGTTEFRGLCMGSCDHFNPRPPEGGRPL